MAKKETKKTKVKKTKQVEKGENPIGLFIKGKPFDYGLFVVILILLTLGLIMILSSSAPYALRTEGDSYFYFAKQLKFAGIGIVLMIALSKIDYRILNSRISWLAYIGGLRTHGISFSSWYWCSKKRRFEMD